MDTTIFPRSPFGRPLRSSLWALALVLCLLPEAASAERIITLRSAPLAVFDAALEGFKAEYRTHAAARAQKTVAPVQYLDRVLAGLSGGAPALLRRVRPDLVVTIGQRALESVAATKGFPILYLMAVKVPEGLSDRDDVYGVSMGVGPEQWAAAYAGAMPRRPRVGVVYDPRRTGAWLDQAVRAGGLYGLVVRAEAVDTPLAVAGALGRIEGRVDALWMIPDLTVIRPETTALFARFSLEQDVPVFSFAERFLSKGATAALVRSPGEIGRQGARWAAQMVGADRDGADVKQVTAPRVVMRLNPSLALRFLPRSPARR